MIITTCGFGNTGASAVLDFLKGYDRVSLAGTFEFQLVHMPDGLLDLKYHLVKNRERIACNAAIKRFKKAALNGWFARKMRNRLGAKYYNATIKYINKVSGIEWEGASVYDPGDVSNLAQNKYSHIFQAALSRFLRLINNDFHFPQYQKRYFSILGEYEFDNATREYLQDVFSIMEQDRTKDMLADMLVSATDPSAGLEFLGDTKVMIIHRDPIDLFIRANTHKATNTFMPCGDVEKFVRYYRSLMTNSIKYDKALYMQYEDLIYNYYPATQKIMDFLGYKERPENEFKYFNPDISVKYTRADLTYPGYDTEIKYIRQNLSEYLYPFPEKYTSAEDQRKKYLQEEKSR